MAFKRREVLLGLAGLSLPWIVSSCTGSTSTTSSPSGQLSPNPSPGSSPTTTSSADQRSGTVRIGYQRFSNLDFLRTRGQLDRRLQAQGMKVEWSFFQAGPPMLEAMNAGSLDFGGVGESPPIFAQAAGTKFYYVARIPRGIQTQDIIVPQNSSIQSAADLRGKKVALQKGSSAHYLLVSVLKDQNIPVNEVEVVSLPPADARAAFEQGSVDAWSIWDPFLAVAESTGRIKNLRLGRDRSTFYLAAKTFADQRPEIVKIILEESKASEAWAQQNTKQLAQQYAADLKIEPAVLEVVTQRQGWGVEPIDEKVILAQQQVADTFSSLQIVPKAVKIQEAILSPEVYSKIFPS